MTDHRNDSCARARADAVYTMVANLWPYPICGQAVRLMIYLFNTRA
jgi:hypothetical protein